MNTLEKTKEGIINEGFSEESFEGKHQINSENEFTEFEDEKIKIMDDFIQKHSSEFNNENLKFSSKLKKLIYFRKSTLI